MPIQKMNQKRFCRWLQQLTSLPAASGREDRVAAWVERWVDARPDLKLRRDGTGNLLLTRKNTSRRAARSRRLWFTAHMDHPAFVVRTRLDDTHFELEFRGFILKAYLEGALIELLDVKGRAHPARIVQLETGASPFPRMVARGADPDARIQAGDIGRWRFPGRSVPGIRKGQLHAPACDDLAALTAALAVLDWARKKTALAHVGVLLTRAEEVGFLGAIAACRNRSISKADRLLCLEATRSYPDAPLGGGPILRVGDQIGIFDSHLTHRIGCLLHRHQKTFPGFRWQRKLMSGGACEASAFGAYGYTAACACLPLGNYHNMRDPDTKLLRARAVPERIDLGDFYGLIELLSVVAMGLDDPEIPSLKEVLGKRFEERKSVLYP